MFMKHNKFNFRETYLNEGFFDDIEDDIMSDHQETIAKNIQDIADNKTVKTIEEELTELFNIRDNLHNDVQVKCTYDDNGVFTVQTNKNYCIEIPVSHGQKVQHVFDMLKNLNCTLFQMNSALTIHCDNNNLDYVEIDFYNIPISCGIQLIKVRPKNLQLIYKPVNLKNQYRYWLYCKLAGCDLTYQNSISIECNKCDMMYCVNIKDFSFLKEIKDDFSFTFVDSLQFPQTYNFTGLPNGKYKIDINHQPKSDAIYDGTISLIGIPDDITQLIYDGIKHPISTLANFSLEGLTKELSDKSTFSFSGFYNKTTVVQIGPYKSIPKIRSYKISKKILDYVVKSHDYYIDCYEESTGPNKAYNPDGIDDKLLKRAQSDQATKNRLQDEAKLKMDTLIKYGQKYLIKDSVWSEKRMHRGFRYFKVINTTNSIIAITKDNLASVNGAITKRLSWSEFFKWITSVNNTYYNKEGKSIQELIINPATAEYWRIKEKLKDQRKKEREKAKLDKSSQPISLTQKQKESDPVITTPVKKSNIEIIDYSDKAIAIFGNTYDIKDKIKELGGKFNPYLKYKDGEKKPGWIISKKKQKEIESLIN